MYLEHFGLTDEPFRLDPDTEYLYLSPGHRRARTFMEYALFREGGFVVVTGDVGTGKTTLVEDFLGGLGDEVEIARLARTRMEPLELLQSLASRLGIPAFEGNRLHYIEAITAHLEANYRDGRISLVVVDEAQALGRDALEELRLLTEFGGGRGRRLHVLLVGQPELGDLLDGPGMDQFLQRVRLRMHLTPLEPEEMAAYVAHRLRVAGGDPDLFDSSACQRVHEFTGGVPRLVNVLCDTALMIAYGEGRQWPGVTSVDEAIAELGWRPYVERAQGSAPVGGTEGALGELGERLVEALGEIRDELRAGRERLEALLDAPEAGGEAVQPVDESEDDDPGVDARDSSDRSGWMGLRRRQERP
ncbi:ExeA family protein [Thiohalospira sp.]|uniref:ExeA family protein n=1 Tax=Thiohalospira sp. TaxID=3080549 RepID=UPI0039809A0F